MVFEEEFMLKENEKPILQPNVVYVFNLICGVSVIARYRKTDGGDIILVNAKRIYKNGKMTEYPAFSLSGSQVCLKQPNIVAYAIADDNVTSIYEQFIENT